MRILNIGSGPVTKGDSSGLDIIHADRRDYGEHVEYQNMEELAYPDDTFDLVVCINALDHTRDAERAIKELIRVSKKWVYVDCALIQHTTSGKNHYWDMLEDGTLENEIARFNLKSYGFEIDFLHNGGKRRYNHVVATYQK